MKYTWDNLENLLIYTLREIGREVGVKSPSSKKKYDLIQEIINIQNGTTAPYFTNLGRPTLGSIPPFPPKNNSTEIEREMLEKIEAIEKEVQNFFDELKILLHKKNAQ